MSRHLSTREKGRIRAFHVKHPEVTQDNLARRFQISSTTIQRILREATRRVLATVRGPGVKNITRIAYDGKPIDRRIGCQI